MTINELKCDSWTNKNNNLTKLYPGTSHDKDYCRNFGLLSTGFEQFCIRVFEKLRCSSNLVSGPFCLVNLERSPGKVLIEPCFDHCEDSSEKKPCVGPDKMIVMEILL